MIAKRDTGKKILLAIGSLDIGGAEKQLIALAGGLTQAGSECRVFVLNGHGKLRLHLERIHVPVISAWDLGDQKRRPWRTGIAQLKLIDIARHYKPDVIHAFLPLMTFMGTVAGRLCKIPLVITSRRALGTHQERYRFLRPLDLMANAWSHRVTVNSKAVWNDVVRRDHIDPRKLILIYNAVDPTPYESACLSRERMRQKLGLKPEERAVIVIANLIPYKGHHDFLKAARRVKDRIPEATFWLVGEDRGIQKDLEIEAQNLGLSESVLFMGQRSDIPSLLAASDLFVLPSHEEGFSNVILEAMAAGLPVVATEVGGNSEAVADGETGWLVPPRNPSAMAGKIVDLLSDPGKATSWGILGKGKVKKHFTIEQMVEKHLALYAGAPLGRGQ